ncbi:PD-(D/E)XK nuclease family protein, partial [Candidatus Dependentiae bacterium]|nr:PD-(D/E)XK nuclease family protein [Candidatus Dependentiae bacterium]
YLEYHQKSKGLFFKAPNFIKGLKNRLGDENLSLEERKPLELLIEGYITEQEITKPKLLEIDKSLFYKSKEVNIVLHFDLYLQYKDGKKSIVVFKTTNNYNIPENLYNDFEPQLYKYVLDDNGEYPADYLEFFYLKFNKFIRLEFSKINKAEAYSSIKQMFDAIDSDELDPIAGPVCDWCDYQNDCTAWKDDRFPEVPFEYRKDKLRFSFSRLSSYLQCPFKYKKMYIEKTPQKPMGFFSIGTTIHAVMEDIYKWPSAPSYEKLLRLYDKYWEPAGYRTEAEKEKYYNSGKEWLKTYFDKFISDKEWKKAVAVEKYFEIPIGNYFTIGFIDMIYPCPDGTVEVIDYKTNPEVKTQEQVDKDLQLTLYQYVLEKLGYKVSNISLIFMRFGEKVSTLKTPEDLLAFEKYFIESVAKAELEKEYKPQKNEYCNNCQFKSICPLFSNNAEQLNLI